MTACSVPQPSGRRRSSSPWILAAEQVPQKLAEGVLAMSQSPWVVLLLVNVVLFVLGIWLEPAPLLIILAEQPSLLTGGDGEGRAGRAR